MSKPVRTAIIGAGGMARHHLKAILQQPDRTQVVVVCEPSQENYELFADKFIALDLPAPPNEPDLSKLLANYPLDVAFIITPHVYHHNQTLACLEAGLDVLLEKPMVMNAEEAHSLIEARDRTGRLLVVAFNGSLSPEIRKAADMIADGELGEVLSISATVWQDWGENQVGAWRQDFKISGGGFLFDTGAHMLNTVVDLAGEPVVEVAAWLDKSRRPVDTMAVVIGRLASGALVTLHACGETIPSCDSIVQVFGTKAILKTGVWGRTLERQKAGKKKMKPVKVKASSGAWEQFLAVRDGTMPNPSPPEVGLRMAVLYDAILESAALDGAPVQCGRENGSA
jgi:predicted dehydrogenase